MTRLHGRISAHVFFYHPTVFPEQWIKTASWQEAKRIPGVDVLSDENGDEAKRFGAKTSGQTMLYDASGNLLFSGGITDSRGHEGDNAGLRSLVSTVLHGTRGLPSTPVFGCSLGTSSVSPSWKQ